MIVDNTNLGAVSISGAFQVFNEVLSTQQKIIYSGIALSILWLIFGRK